MRPSPDTDRPLERVLLVVMLAVVLFATPVTYLWAGDDSPWFMPYLLWLIVIVLIGWSSFRNRPHDV